MASDASSNLDRLREVDMVLPDELPQEYQAVVDGLTPDEVDLLVAVKKRLDEAERVSGVAIPESFIAP